MMRRRFHIIGPGLSEPVAVVSWIGALRSLHAAHVVRISHAVGWRVDNPLIDPFTLPVVAQGRFRRLKRRFRHRDCRLWMVVETGYVPERMETGMRERMRVCAERMFCGMAEVAG